MERQIIKKLRKANCCLTCRRHKDDESGNIICTLDGVEEYCYMICNHYDSPKEYKARGYGSALQNELDKIQNQLKKVDE